MSILILGDLHLGAGQSLGKNNTGTHINSRLMDQINLLDYTLDKCIEHCVSDLIITGDVFEDPKPLPNIVSTFISWLKQCQINNINVHIAVGNHDVLRTGNIYISALDIISEADLDNVIIYNTINTFIVNTTAITIMPFRDRKSLNCKSNKEAIEILSNNLDYELAGIPLTYTAILVGHMAIEGSIPIGNEIDDMTNELFLPLHNISGYDYVWMGHVHKPQILETSPYIAHIGSMDISNFGETDHKKHIIIFDTDTHSFITEYLPTRNLKKIIISVPKDQEDATEYVLNELKQNADFDKSIVKVQIDLNDLNQKSVNKSVIEKYLISKGVFNVAGISESKKISLVKKTNDQISTKMDVESAIKAYASAYVNEDLNSDFIEAAMSIYDEYKANQK